MKKSSKIVIIILVILLFVISLTFIGFILYNQGAFSGVTDQFKSDRTFIFEADKTVDKNNQERIKQLEDKIKQLEEDQKVPFPDGKIPLLTTNQIGAIV